MLVFSQLVRGIAPATILDCWLLGSNMAGRGRWLFYFSSICGWGSRASPWARSGCWLSGLHLWPCIRIFFTLLSYCLLLTSCATSFLVKARWWLRQWGLLCKHPSLPLEGQGFSALGTWETWKRQQGCGQGFVSACQLPIRTDSSSIFQSDASAPPFFISLGRQKGQPQLYFHQGKVRITHRSAARVSLDLYRHDWSGLIITLGEKGSPNCFDSSAGWPCRGAGVRALSLRADFHQQQEQTGISGWWRRVGTCPSSPRRLFGSQGWQPKAPVTLLRTELC